MSSVADPPVTVEGVFMSVSRWCDARWSCCRSQELAAEEP